MKYGILGPLAAWDDDRELALGGVKQRGLLAVLLLRADELVPTARLVDELWGGSPPATAVKTVQVYVSQLRKLLGEAAIETRPPGYVLRLEPGALDLHRFEAGVDEGRRLLAAGDPARAVVALREALAIWRGPALADFGGEAFAATESARLEELRLAAVEQRLEAELALGLHAQAVPELEALVREHPLRESLRRLLMLALYRGGRQADALAVYQNARRTLVDDLGLEPGQALQQLEKAILVHHASLDLEPAPRSPPSDESSRAPARSAPPATCDRCGAANEPAARFCHACGAELALELAIELRKTVTVLFCDVVASTELGERLDPESHRRLMSRYFDEAAAVLDRHGGTVEKFIGDEVMAVFGVPAVRQDDALRAVRAAAELRERLSALSLPEWDTRLQVRIGVNTGEVVAGDPAAGHAFVTGDAVVVGKRLQQAAQPGEVLLGEETHALVAHAVEAEPLGALAAKNKRAGVGAYRLQGVDADPQPFPPRQDVPLVGRDAELKRLLARYALAAGGQGAQLVTVVGQAGIGKSRLARELAARAGGEAAVLVGRCRPYGEGITFWPLRELLAQAGRDELLEGSGHELFAAARRALEELAAQRPLVAVFEDVHWAEPTLLDLVEYLAARLGHARVLLLCLARPELEERRREWLRDAIVLEPLSEADSETLLGELGTPKEVRPRIAEAAAGNPLFVEQLAAAAGERGDATELPASLRGVLAERLDRLDREERAVLERAAVAGREFSLDWVVHLSPPRLRERAPARLLALARKELVVADPDATADEGFRFRHALIRDAAYEGMPKVLRADLHEQMAARLEAEGQDDALIGYHLEHAYRHREQLGRVDGRTVELGRRAALLIAASGKRALESMDLPAAVAFFERARALLPADDRARATVLGELGYARIKAGDFAAAESDLAEAIEAARLAGNRRAELHALVDRQFARSFVAPKEAASENVQLAKSLIPELEDLGDELGLAKAWWLKSEGDVFACRWRDRSEALERALAHARRSDASLDEVSTISALLSQALLYGPTPVPDAIARCRELLGDGGGDRAMRAAVGTSLAALLAMQGEFAAARRAYSDAVAIYEEFGFRIRRAMRTLVGAQIELLAGNPAAAEAELRAGVEIVGGVGAPGIGATLAVVLADVLLTSGRREEAEALAREAAAAAPDDDLMPQVLWRSTLGRALALRGELAEAKRLVDEAVRLTDGVDFPDLRVTALLGAAEIQAASGGDAGRLLAEARSVMAAKGNVVVLGQLEAAPAIGFGAAAQTE